MLAKIRCIRLSGKRASMKAQKALEAAMPSGPLGPAENGQQGNRAVKDEEGRQCPGEDLAEAAGNFQNQLCHHGIEGFHPKDTQKAPENGIDQADPPVDIEGHMAVVPADGAEKHFLRPGAEVFQGTAHQEAPQKGQPFAPGSGSGTGQRSAPGHRRRTPC